MGDLHGDPCSFSAPMFVLFLGGLHGILFFLRCATCSSDSASVHACATFNAVLCTFSTPPLVLLGAGSPFFLRFQCGAVLYFRCWARGARLCFLLCLGAGRLFGFAVSWLCECRLSHLGGGVNKKNTLPGGRPAKVEPAEARVRGAGTPQSGGQ